MVKPKKNDLSVLIIAGETSSDKYGAHLVQAVKTLCPSLSFFGIGGQHMEEEGVDLLFHVRDISLVGFEIIFCLFNLLKIFKRLDLETTLRKPAAAILIDSPDFNLRLAKKLKKRLVPVLYFIGPTVWAWRKGRLKTIKNNVTKMLLIFPFEEKIYHDHQIPAIYVGHPLKGRIRPSLSREEFFEKYQLNPDKRLITFLPGSRRSELKFHLPVLLQSVKRFREKFNAQFILLQAENLDERLYSDYLSSSREDLRMIREDKYEAMASSDLILAACGTANLEAVLLEVPLVSFYRISPFYYWAGVRFVKIENFSITNILAGKKVVPELIQKQFTAENLFIEAQKILESEQMRSEMIRHFKSIKQSLGDQSTFQNVAGELRKIICPG